MNPPEYPHAQTAPWQVILKVTPLPPAAIMTLGASARGLALNAGAMHLIAARDAPVRQTVAQLRGEWPAHRDQDAAPEDQLFSAALNWSPDQVLGLGVGALNGDSLRDIDTYAWSAAESVLLMVSGGEQQAATEHPGVYRYVSAVQIVRNYARTLYWLRGLNDDSALSEHLEDVLGNFLGHPGITPAWLNTQVADAQAGMTLSIPLTNDDAPISLYVFQGADLSGSTRPETGSLREQRTLQ